MAALLALLSLLTPALAVNILVVVPTPSISHQLPFRAVALRLTARGHNVTIITPDPIRRNIENYTEIDMSFTYKYWTSAFDFTSMAEASTIEVLKGFFDIGAVIATAHFESDQIKDFLRSAPKFDLLIFESLMYTSYFGVAHAVGSPPMVGFLSLMTVPPLVATLGNPNNPAYYPDFVLPYSDHMDFWQRLRTAYTLLWWYYLWYYKGVPEHEQIMRTYFGSEPPPILETESNVSLLVSGSHFSIFYPHPRLPNTIELTGLHIDTERKPLPQNIQKFLDAAENGVIYFSLGSNVKSSDMPEEKRRSFLEAFSSLPQRVLWKFEADSLPGQPDNVMVAKWLPQQDVLAHPQVVLFITQGGLQSINEASYYGVPVIGIPFFGDQFFNVMKMVAAGVGSCLSFEDISKETVSAAVQTVLGDESYRENMRRFSAVYREHQAESLDKAVWWVEYVIRHNGARHLRSAAMELRWWQYYLLDVFLFLLAAVTLLLVVLYKCSMWIARSLWFRQKAKKS